MYKTYKAYQFYRENVGRVEIKNYDGELVVITFAFPSYFPLLTQQTKDKMSDFDSNLSQQEKLIVFIERTELCQIEMKWQQRLNQLPALLFNLIQKWQFFERFGLLFVLLANLINLIFLQTDLDDQVILSNILGSLLINIFTLA